MEQNNSQLTGAVTNLAEATLVDLPCLAIGRLFDRIFSDELRKARWKAYDAAVAIASELTNRLCSSRRVGRVSARALDALLKLQRLADAASGAFFAALWPMVGLPTASEMRRLSDETESLRKQWRPNELGVDEAHQLRFEALPCADKVGKLSRFRLLPTIEELRASGYGEMLELFQRWMSSDVPLAGQIFRDVASLGRENKLYRNEMMVGGRHIDVKSISCPLLNVVAELDDVVHPKASLPLPDFVSSLDRRDLTFPTGHIGAAVSGPALQKLWPEIGRWLSEHD